MDRLSVPDLLGRVSRAGAFEHLKLRDLMSKRLEELSHNLKKRSFIVDQSEDLLLTISEEFENLSGMIVAHGRLIAENERLKNEEGALRADAVVKRRNLKALSGPLLADMAVVLQRELAVQTAVGCSFQEPARRDPGGSEFDAFMAAEAPVIEFARTEFATTVNMDHIQALSEAQTAPGQLEALRNIVVGHEMTAERLHEELQPLGEKTHNTGELAPCSQREARLRQLHDRFQGQIEVLQTRVSEANAESARVFGETMAVIDVR